MSGGAGTNAPSGLVAARARLGTSLTKGSHQKEMAMLATQAEPVTLRAAVLSAVQEGAWAPADVVASVATDNVADRAAVIATLWDLVEEGCLRYDGALVSPGFRPRS